MPIVDPFKQASTGIIDPFKQAAPASLGAPGPMSAPTDRPTVAPWKRTVSSLAHDVIPSVGLAAGGIAGGALGAPAGGVGAIPGGAVGAGLGYAAGNKLADLVDTGLGMGQVQTIPQTIKSTVRDVVVGAPMGLVGPEMAAGKSLLYAGAKAGALTNAAMGATGRAYDTLAGDRQPGGELGSTVRDAAIGGLYGVVGAGMAKGALSAEEAARAGGRAIRQGQGISGAVKSAVGSVVPEGLPGKILQKAARIPESNLTPAERAKRYQTLAENGGTFDQKGYDTYNKNLDQLQNRFEAAISPYRGKVVGSQPVVDALEALKSEAPFQSNPERFLSVINKRLALYQTQVDENGISTPAPFERLTVGQAQKLKVQRNKDLAPVFNRQDKSFVNPLPSEEMQVLNAERGALKSHIEQSTGDANIRELNAHEGQMLSAGQLLTKAVSKAENASNLSAFHLARTAMAAGAGTLAGGPGAGLAGAGLSVAATPRNLSRVAVGLQNARTAYNEGVMAALPPGQGFTMYGKPYMPKPPVTPPAPVFEKPITSGGQVAQERASAEMRVPIRNANAVSKASDYGSLFQPHEPELFGGRYLNGTPKFIDTRPKAATFEDAPNLASYIRRNGGLSLTKAGDLRGEVEAFSNRETGSNGLVREGGESVDRMLEKAIEDGLLPQGSTSSDLLEMLRSHVDAEQSGKFKPKRRSGGIREE